MTRLRHGLHGAYSYGNLLASQILTEAMERFPAGTPAEDVVRWIHERLSYYEEGLHFVGFFGVNAVKFQPTFTINAVKIKPYTKSFTLNARKYIIPTPGSYTIDARKAGGFGIRAVIHRTMPTSVVHHDAFGTQVLNSWGSPDIGKPYTYTNSTAESRHEKYDFDPDPLVTNIYGHILEYHSTNYYTNAQDTDVQDKEYYLRFSCERGDTTETYWQFGFRGTDNYVRYKKDAPWSNDQMWIYVGGVEVAGPYNFGGVFSGEIKVRIQAIGTTTRAKMWQGSTEPAWQLSYDGGTPVAGNSFIRPMGEPYILSDNGSPWDHYFYQWTVTALSQGAFRINAFKRGAFLLHAWISQGSPLPINAFIQPYFRISARIVIRNERYFTLDALIPDDVHGDIATSAFVQPYFRINARKQQPRDGSFGIEARIVNRTVGSIFTNAVKERRQTGTRTINAVKWKSMAGSTTIDAVKYDPDRSGLFSLAAWKSMGGPLPAYAIKKRLDQPGSKTADAIVWPGDIDLGGGKWQRLRHYEANAVKYQEQSGSFSIGAIKLYQNDDIVHHDVFSRTVSNSWGVPSHKGRYDYTIYGGSQDYFDVDGTYGTYYDRGYDHDVVWADNDGTRNKEVLFKANIYEPWSVVETFYDFGIRPNVFLRSRHSTYGSYWDLYVDGSLRTSVEKYEGGWFWVRARVIGRRIRARFWADGSSEPGSWDIDYDATSIGHTPTAGDSWLQSQSHFLVTNPYPQSQYFGHWQVWSLDGPTIDARVRPPNVAGSYSIDARSILQRHYGTAVGNAWVNLLGVRSGAVEADAIKFLVGPTSVRVTDDFSTDEEIGWGTPDIGAAYTYSGDGSTYWVTGGQGVLYANYTSQTISIKDGGAYDKDLLFKFDSTEHNASIANNIYITFRSNAYLRIELANNNDSYYLVVDDTQRAASASTFFSPTWLRIHARGDTYRVKHWLQSESEPAAWTFVWQGGTTGSMVNTSMYYTGDNWFGTGGAPWYVYFGGISSVDLSAGYMALDAWKHPHRWLIDAVIWATIAKEFGIEAELLLGAIIRIDAITLRNMLGSLSVDSRLKMIPVSLPANATKKKVGGATTNTEYLRPNSDLYTYGTWAYSSGSTGWNLIDEASLDTGDWVYSDHQGGVTDRMDHGYTDPTATPYNATINKLTFVTVDANPAVGFDAHWYIQDRWGTPHYLTNIPQSGTTTYTVVKTVRPWDGQPWEYADLFDLRTYHTQPGYATTGYGDLRIYQTYIAVQWTGYPYLRIDAIKHQEITGTIGSNAVKYQQGLGAYTLDAYLAGFINIDAIKHQEQGGSYSIEAEITAEQHSLFIDARILKTHSGTLALDAVIKNNAATSLWFYENWDEADQTNGVTFQKNKVWLSENCK